MELLSWIALNIVLQVFKEICDELFKQRQARSNWLKLKVEKKLERIKD